MLKALLALPSTVWLLGFVSLLNDAASDLIYPLIPLYLASVLMTGPGPLGIIEGVAETISGLLKLVSGAIADRFRHTKTLVVVGYALAAISRPLLTLASSWPMVLALRLTDRVGKGLRSAPRDAMLAACVQADRRGLAFGLQRAMDNAGAVAGPFAAAVMLAEGMPLRDIFLWTLIPGLLSVALAASVKEPTRQPPTADMPFDWRLRQLPADFRRYLVVLALFTLGNSSNMFLLLRARELGLPEYQTPMLWGLTSAVATLFSAPLAAWSDRLGRRRLIVAGWMLYAGFYVSLGLLDKNGVLLWPLFALYGLFLAATEGAEKALVADMAPAPLLGTAYGWFNLVTGLMLLPASLLFGLAWQYIAPLTAFVFAGACALLASTLMIGWVGTTRAD